jgi:hypothetical protein
MPMTAKERVMAAISFQQPDYMPLELSFWPEFAQKWRQAHPDAGEVSLEEYYGVDIKIAVGDESPYPGRAGILGYDGDYEIRRDGWGRTVRTRQAAQVMHQIDHAYDDTNRLKYGDFEPPDLPQRYARLDEVMDRWKRDFCVFAKTGGPFIRTYFMTGEVNLLTSMAADVQLASEQIMRTAHHLSAIGLEQLRRWDLYDTGVWIFDDMASTQGPMFSPRTAEQVMAPAWAYMVDEFKAAGAAKVILHSDGNIGPLLDLLIDLGFDGINPVEHKAGLDCVKLREKYGDRLALIGGLSNDVILPRGDPDEIRDHVRYIMSAGTEGGLVLGTHSVGPDIAVESWDLVYQTYLQHRNYPLQL